MPGATALAAVEVRFEYLGQLLRRGCRLHFVGSKGFGPCRTSMWIGDMGLPVVVTGLVGGWRPEHRCEVVAVGGRGEVVEWCWEWNACF